MALYVLQRATSDGSGWADVRQAESVNEFGREVTEYAGNDAGFFERMELDGTGYRVILRTDNGEEIWGRPITGDDNGEAYHAVKCFTGFCVASVHPGGEHVDSTGHAWKEGE